MTEPHGLRTPDPERPLHPQGAPRSWRRCGYHPAPADPPEQRRPEPAQTCQCDRPLVLSHRDGEPARCFLCARPLPGQPATRETLNGDEQVEVHHLVTALSQHREQRLERHRDLLRISLGPSRRRPAACADRRTRGQV